MIRATSSLRCHACRTASSSSRLFPLKSNHTSISIITAHRSIHFSGSRRNTRGTSQGNSAKQAHSSSSSNNNNSNAFVETPAPPRLPPHLQKEFEELQRIAASPLAATSTTTTSSNDDDIALEEHPDIRQKPKPEFEGDRNPKTGEIGGPKNNPLSYEKEWTYGGRATDF